MTELNTPLIVDVGTTCALGHWYGVTDRLTAAENQQRLDDHFVRVIKEGAWPEVGNRIVPGKDQVRQARGRY